MFQYNCTIFRQHNILYLKPADNKHILLPEDSTRVPEHIGDTSLILYPQLILCIWLVQ